MWGSRYGSPTTSHRVGNQEVAGSSPASSIKSCRFPRGVLALYFKALRTALERHGGFVEKYIGDAVMAVFGLTVILEDDALRAVRAAAEARVALRRLGDELETDFGIRLAARIGVNTRFNM